MKNGLEREYKKLKKKYEALKKQYKAVETQYEMVRERVQSRMKKHFLALLLIIIASVGFYYYRHPVILITGLITSATDLVFELYCTKKRLWEYEEKKYLIKNRIPIDIPIVYFLIGAVGVIYILFRLGY